MSVLAAIKAVLWWGLLPAVVAGILAIWHYATATQGIVIGLVIAGILVAAVGVYLVWPARDHVHDDPDAAEKQADEHMAPLRRPGQAEQTLTRDLHARGMLLRPHGLDPRRAAVLARKVVSRTARARLARAPRTPGRHAAPGKPLGLSGSAKAAARRPEHGGQPAAPALMMVAGAGLDVTPADPLPALPDSETAADPGLHEPTLPLDLPAEEDPAAFTDWETGSFAAICGVELPGQQESDAA